jgi:hypothetical protein
MTRMFGWVAYARASEPAAITNRASSQSFKVLMLFTAWNSQYCLSNGTQPTLSLGFCSLLSSLHALLRKAVLGRTRQRLALRAHRLAFAGVPLAPLHEARFSCAGQRFALCAHRLGLAGLRRGSADRKGRNCGSKNSASHRRFLFACRTHTSGAHVNIEPICSQGRLGMMSAGPWGRRAAQSCVL